MDKPAKQQGHFDRLAWRKGLEELDPAARAAIAAVAAEKERPTDLDIDRMVAGLGANAETNAETDEEAT
jgi:hypothetical protein